MAPDDSMTENSPTWVDVKIMVEGRPGACTPGTQGYRSDRDMSAQVLHIADATHSILSETVFIPSVVLTVFQGWWLIAIS